MEVQSPRACALRKRSHGNEQPGYCNREAPSPQLERASMRQRIPTAVKKKTFKKFHNQISSNSGLLKFLPLLHLCPSLFLLHSSDFCPCFLSEKLPPRSPWTPKSSIQRTSFVPHVLSQQHLAEVTTCIFWNQGFPSKTTFFSLLLLLMPLSEHLHCEMKMSPATLTNKKCLSHQRLWPLDVNEGFQSCDAGDAATPRMTAEEPGDARSSPLPLLR